MRAMNCVRLLVMAALLASCCGVLQSSPGPTPTRTQGELIYEVIASVGQQRQAYESKLSELGQEIAAGQESMSPEVLSTRLRTYATYQQAIARYEEIETQLDLVKVTLEAQVALGNLAGTDEALKDASVLIQQYIHVDPLPTLAPGSVDEVALLDEIRRSAPTPAPALPATPVPTAEPLQVHPYCDPRNRDVRLQDLAAGWGESTSPGHRTWQVVIEDPNDPVLVEFLSCYTSKWCDCERPLLENLQHIQYMLTVDGQDVDPSSLCVELHLKERNLLDETPTCCQKVTGMISEWTKEHHNIVMTYLFAVDTSDGEIVYPQGTYSNEFDVTVKMAPNT